MDNKVMPLNNQDRFLNHLALIWSQQNKVHLEIASIGKEKVPEVKFLV